MDRDAEIRSADVPAREQIVDNRTHDGGGRGRRGAPGERGVVETDHAARRRDEWAAGEPVVHREIEAQYAVNPSSLWRAPSVDRGTHDAEARSRRASWASDGENQRPDGTLVRLCSRRRGGKAIRAEDDEIRLRIASGNRRLQRVAVWEGDGNAAVATNRMTCRDDQSIAPDDAAGRNPPPRANRDRVLRRAFDGGREL